MHLLVTNALFTNFWLPLRSESVNGYTDLKNRGLNDIFVACVDGLAGFPEAIQAAYPNARVQLCIVHLVRAALRYVSTEDSKAVVEDLKKIYQASSVLEAESALENFAQAWDEKYPTISKQWRVEWQDIITLFDFPPPIRKAIYTTNAIESVNSVIPTQKSCMLWLCMTKKNRPRESVSHDRSGQVHVR